MYQKSECKIKGYLHDYLIKEMREGISMEVCRRCKDRQFFKPDTPSKDYLSFHLRSALPKYHKLFNHEYNG